MSMTEPTPKRGPGRPSLRPDTNRTSLRDRLRASAPKTLESLAEDKFAVPGAERHEGVSLQWKRYSVKGEHDPYYIASLRQNGWEPMQAEDFPELPNDGSGSIIKEGMILMGRPAELTRQAEALLETRAKKQIRDQQVQVGLAPNGTLARVNTDLRGQKLGVQTEVLRQVTVED
jgi:hypothetical protein